MDLLRKLWPLSFRKKNSLTDLLAVVIVFIIVDFVCGLAIGLLSHLPLIGGLISLVGSIIGLYFLVGIILTILDYLKLLK